MPFHILEKYLVAGMILPTSFATENITVLDLASDGFFRNRNGRGSMYRRLSLLHWDSVECWLVGWFAGCRLDRFNKEA